MKIAQFFQSIIAAALLFTPSLQAEEGCCFEPQFCCTKWDIGVNASFLYWAIQEDCLGYAITDITIFEYSPPASNSKILTHNQKWTPGVRVGASLSNQSTPFGLNLEWTHFDGSDKRSASSPDPTMPTLAVTTITATFNNSPFSLAESVKSRWEFDINEYAFDIHYSGCCGEWLFFKPYIGVYGATFNQHQHCQYFGVLKPGYPFDADSMLEVTRTTDFWGVGPRLGFIFNWNLWGDIRLIGNIYGAYLAGHYDIRNEFVGELMLSPFESIKQGLWRGRPTISGLAGIEWRKCLPNNTAFTISAGYEFQYWWSAWNSSSNFLNDDVSGEGRWGDLSMGGLNLNFGFYF